ncbi:MAG: hypothetical protein ACK5U2_05945 [Microcystis sp.]|uniref:hypothetical protein n=1 Tax=Microcystis sp. TaxID=1127 RepID=UPI00391B8C2D
MDAERNGRKIVVEIKSFLILNPLSNAQKTGFSEKPVFYSCKNNQICYNFSILTDRRREGIGEPKTLSIKDSC